MILEKKNPKPGAKRSAETLLLKLALCAHPAAGTKMARISQLVSSFSDSLNHLTSVKSLSNCNPHVTVLSFCFMSFRKRFVFFSKTRAIEPVHIDHLDVADEAYGPFALLLVTEDHQHGTSPGGQSRVQPKKMHSVQVFLWAFFELHATKLSRFFDYVDLVIYQHRNHHYPYLSIIFSIFFMHFTWKCRYSSTFQAAR